MVTATGVIVLAVGLVAWVGQSLALLAPSLAVRLGLLEPEGEIDPTLRIVEARAEGLTDLLLTWTLPLSGWLLAVRHPWWPHLALVGGGVFLYVAGLITFSRVFLKRTGRKVGRPSAARGAYAFAGIWALASIVMIALAVVELSPQELP